MSTVLNVKKLCGYITSICFFDNKVLDNVNGLLLFKVRKL